MPLDELNLAANGMGDSEFGQLVARVITTHCEYRDQIFWQYGLRNELPPPHLVIGLKQLDLSFNKLSTSAAMYISRSLKTD